MGLLVGCAMLPMALALLALVVVMLVQEPLALVGLVGLIWLVRSLWRAHLRELRRRDGRD